MAVVQPSELVDVTAKVPPVSGYVFLGAAAGQTIKGIFVDSNGKRVGPSFSLSINEANGTNVAVALSTNIPADASGAIVRFSGTTYVDLMPESSDDFKANYANYPQYTAADGNVFLGRVNA